MQGRETDVAFLKEMLPDISTVVAVLALERHYYNMVLATTFRFGRSTRSLISTQDTALSALMDESVRERLAMEATKVP